MGDAEWSLHEANEMHKLKLLLSEMESACQRDRPYEVVLCRLRNGHTRLMHPHNVHGENPPECENCQEPLSALHILLECPAHEDKRRHFYSLLYKDMLIYIYVCYL